MTDVFTELFGYLADDDSFVFADDSIGKEGMIKVQGDKLIILMDDYGEIVPYAVIEIEYIGGSV